MRRRITSLIMATAITGAGFLTSGGAHADPEADVAIAPIVAPCASVATGIPIVVPGGFTPALSDTRSAGHFQLAGTSLHVFTDDSSSLAKVAEYGTVPATALGTVGEPALAWTGSATPPGFQMIVDLENDGTADGILVGEPAFYGNRWWASTALRNHIGLPVPAALDKPAGNGSAVAGTLSEWLGTYPNARIVGVGFSLGSGVKGDGEIASLTFACVQRSFAAAPPATPIEFSQTEFFGSTAAGSSATASYLISSGPNGRSADDGAVIIGIDYVTAAELASCTVTVDEGPAGPIVIQYDPIIDGTTYSGALLYVADDLVIESGFSLGIDVVCQTTAGAVLGDYALWAAFTYGSDEVQIAAIAVQPGAVGTLDDVLSITAAPAVVTTAPTTDAPVPTTSVAVLAATGPAEASGALRMGLIALVAGVALVGAGAVRRAGSTRQH